MASMSSKVSISFYYGYNNLSKLRQYQKIVLQPSHYSKEQIAVLNKSCETYAYVSMGEDATSNGPCKLAEKNPEWGSSYVDISSKLWHEYVLKQAGGYFEQGFKGIFMDTLDAIDVYPEHRDDLLSLLAALKNIADGKPLMANRGFSLMPELKKYIDSIVFEGFSCIWTEDGSSRILNESELLWTKRIAEELGTSGLEVYALDYSENPEMKKFAAKRAKDFGFVSVISNRNLTFI